MRTGSEPTQARSALRMRRVFTWWGLIWAVAGVVIFTVAGQPGWAIACGIVVAVAVVDLVVIAHRMRQGPHWQPGPDVPAYHPADEGLDRRRR